MRLTTIISKLYNYTKNIISTYNSKKEEKILLEEVPLPLSIKTDVSDVKNTTDTFLLEAVLKK